MRILLFCILQIILFPIFCQKLDISAVVVDEDYGFPLSGVWVKEKNQENATVTDEKGRFQLTINEGNAIILQLVGFEIKEIENPSAENKITLKANYILENIVIQSIRADATDPISLTNINRKEIENVYRGQHPIYFLEKFTPSILSFSESGSQFGNYGLIRLRGIEQKRINFTLNGIPLNDMIDHGVFFSNFSDISSSFESIQVQRGIGTSANGVSSYAGSINFESFNVKKNNAFSELSFGVGSFNSLRANYRVNTGLNKNNWGFYSSFSKLQSDGYKKFTESNAYSFFITGGYFGEKDMLKLTAFTARSQNGLGYDVVPKSILRDNPTFNYLTDDDNDDFSQSLVQLQYVRSLTSHWQIDASLYMGLAGGEYAVGTPDEDSVYVENYYTLYKTHFFQINYPLNNTHLGGLLNAHFQSDKLELSSGIHFYNFLRENRENIEPQKSNPYYKDKTSKQEFDGFVKVKYSLSEKLSLVGDLQARFLTLNIFPDYNFIQLSDLEIQKFGNKEKYIFDWSFVNPRLGFNFQWNENIQSFVSFGRNGREPTKIDLIGGYTLDGVGLDLIRNNPNITAEYVNDLEIGTRINSRKLYLEGILFYMDFENEISPLGESIDFGGRRRLNIADSYRSGLEFSWNYLISKQWNVFGTQTVMKSEIKKLKINDEIVTNKKQILSPEIIHSLGLGFLPIENLKLVLNWRYVSDSFLEYTNDANLITPSFNLFDMGINYEINKNITISFDLNNITDEKYYTYGTPTSYNDNVEAGYLVQSPRNVFLNVRIGF